MVEKDDSSLRKRYSDVELNIEVAIFESEMIQKLNRLVSYLIVSVHDRPPTNSDDWLRYQLKATRPLLLN